MANEITLEFLFHVLSAKNITRGSSNIYLDPQETQALPSGVQSFDSNENIRADLRHFNAGISGFVGAGFTWGRSCLFVEAGGNYGLIKIQKGSTNGKNNTGAAVLTIGYSLAILP